MTPAGGRPIAAAVAALAVLLASVAGHVTNGGAFAPTNLKRLGSNSHESITEAAVTALDREFFSVTSLTRTMKRALGQIVDANAAVDGDQSHSQLHFDNENFAGGQNRIIGLLNRTIADRHAKNGTAARADLGGALHTIQDLYSHSNWIELGHAGPNPDLGRPGHALGPVAGPTEPTCNGSTLITAHLTSGYYGSELPNMPIPTKCRHGGLFDSSPGTGGPTRTSASRCSRRTRPTTTPPPPRRSRRRSSSSTTSRHRSRRRSSGSCPAPGRRSEWRSTRPGAWAR